MSRDERERERERTINMMSIESRVFFFGYYAAYTNANAACQPAETVNSALKPLPLIYISIILLERTISREWEWEREKEREIVHDEKWHERNRECVRKRTKYYTYYGIDGPTNAIWLRLTCWITSIAATQHTDTLKLCTFIFMIIIRYDTIFSFFHFSWSFVVHVACATWGSSHCYSSSLRTPHIENFFPALSVTLSLSLSLLLAPKNK